MSNHPVSSRSGAALVIAIVVLAAMLLIGLPFLFTQSGSLSGTRSYSHGRLASMGQDSAQSMGVAAGASAVSYHWQQDGVTTPTGLVLDDWTDLFHDLNGSDPLSGLRRVGVNRIEVDTRNHVFALPGERFLQALPAAERDALLQRYPTVVGLSIEDESGKLDPNFIDMRGWSRLLQQVGITDWPDGRTPQSDPAHQQLARTLGSLRYELPGGRITSIDQLLFAEPPLTIPGTTTQVPNQRRSLTRTELERLRPYLTLSVPAQARGGLIDLGTVIGVDGPRITLDHDQPGSVLAFAEAPMLTGVSTSLVFSDGGTGTLTIPAFGDAPRLPQVGSAAAIDAPPVINLHQAEPVVRNSFAPSPLPGALAPAPPTNQPHPGVLTGLHSLPTMGADALNRPRSPFDLLSPLAVVDTQGSTHVLASRQGDNGASGPFDANGYMYDGADGTTKLLDARTTVIHIVTGSLERFPQRGYALIKGTNAAGQPDQEIIEYTSSNPVLPLSATAAAARTEVTLYVRRGIDGATGRGNNTAKTFRSGTNSQFYDSPSDLHLTALATREQQPLGIASQGVITIASTSTVTDPAGNQTAQEQHRVIAQALPQESPLEARWDKQVAFHALLAQRHGSLMASFPRPYPRVTDLLPQDSANVDTMGNRYVPYSNPADPELSVGMRPAIMRTLLSHSHLDHSWTLPFSGTTQPAATPTALRTSTGASQSTANYSSGDITPEGLRLDSSRVLVYPNPGSNGFLRDSYVAPAANNPNPNPLEPLHGRQFGLWVRPDAAWTAPVILLDAQLPDENVAESLSGVAQPGQPFDARGEINKGASNLFRLAYEPTAKLLILSLNPGTVQQVNDYGPYTPRELFGTPSPDNLPLRAFAYPAVNPECLGSGGLHPMASAPPSQVQTIQHCTYVGDSFVPGDWHLVQVVFTSNQHGGMSIIVDGLVGRDITRLASAANPPAMTVPGDHLTLPTLVLRADIANTPTVSEVGAKALYLAEIPLDACARAADNTIITGAPAVHAVLPKRGIIRIADEYISYDEISASGSLLRCVRGRRQRTDASSSTDPMTGMTSINWGGAHNLQSHKVGDLVVPGGFAMRNLGGAWFRGGCTLKNPLPDGDPEKFFQIGAEVAEDTLSGSPAIRLRERTGFSVAQVPEFPAHGLILLNSQLLYYHRDGAGANNELMVFYWNSTAFPDPTDTTVPPRIIPVGWVPGLPATVSAGADVVLVSIELAGDPTTVNQPYDFYHQDQNTVSPLRILQVSSTTQDYQARMVQLYDARQSTNIHDNCGRAEWLAYTSIETRTTFPGAENHGNERRTYLMNIMQITENAVTMVRGGFWFNPDYRTGGRGRQRTAFAASDFKTGTYNPALHRFPAGTRVIPVQTTITSPDAATQTPPVDGYPVTFLLEAGDVVTLAPTAMNGTDRMLQMCVRYSANDGFPETRVAMPSATDPVSWNVMNRFFAFTEAIPADWNTTQRNFHMLSWPCWTPEGDLSPTPVPAWRLQRLGWLLPWGNAYAPQFTPLSNGTNRPLAIGLSASGGGINATIDALHSGGTNGWSEDNGRNAQPTELVQANVVTMNADDVWLDEGPLTAPLAIQADTGIFSWPYGLVAIGSEVFAYRRRTDVTDHNNAHAYLLGRSLLGSTRRVHIGRELVLHLPIGPVAEVVDGLPVDDLGQVQFSGFFAAPAMLLTSRNGDVMELTTMPNSHTAPWLRGMYNTTPVAWVPRGGAPTVPNLAPLAIGWWPRYPSALPKRTLTARGDISELLRSRSYAWAGFPLRFHGCQFLPTDPALVTVLSNGDGLFDINALALDATLDWGAADQVMLLPGSQTPNATPIDASQVFEGAQFRLDADEIFNSRPTNNGDTARPVDGAELRVTWNYSLPMLTSTLAPATWLQQAARNGNRAPMIGPVYLRTRAPNKVINVER